jgi:hypothetical protein
VLLREHAGGEPLLRVAGFHRHGGLHDDRPAVEGVGDEVHRAAVNAHAGFKRPPVRIQSRESGQQRGMDVHDPALVALDERRREDAHETRQHDEVRPVAVDLGSERRLERGAVGKRTVVDHGGRDAAPGGNAEAARLRIVADDDGDARRQARIEHRLHVAAAPGDQDDQRLFGHGNG